MPIRRYRRRSVTPRRRSYRRRGVRGLSYGAKAVAKVVNRRLRLQKRTEAVQQAFQAIGAAATATPIQTQMQAAYQQRYVNGPRASGFGAYNFGKSLVKFAKGKTGRALGNIAMDAAERYVGLGGYVSGTTGSGAYYNNMYNPGNDDIGFAGNATDETGAVVFSNREYLGDIKATNAFDNVMFTLNPGLSSTFPFLSQIATNYQCYAFLQLGFEFKTLLSEATNSGSIGQIMMVGNINPSESPIKTAQSFLNRVNAIAATPTNDIVCGIECDPMKLANTTSGGKYTRAGVWPANETQDQYDWGTFQIATNGMPTGQEGETQGQLWVSYTVKLYQPILFDTLGKGILGDAFRFTNVSDTPFWDSGSVTASPNNTIGCDLQASGSFADGYAKIKIVFPEDALFKIFKIQLTIHAPVVNGAAGWGTDTPIPFFTNFNNCSQQKQITAGYAVPDEVNSSTGSIALGGLNCLGTQNVGINEADQPIQYAEASTFGCSVLLDGVYGTESSVDFYWDFVLAGHVPVVTFSASSMILTITQCKPDFCTSSVESKYYADWTPISIF